MGRVPIIKIGDTLIATVQEDLHDRDALDLQADVSQALERTGARGVLLDLTVVEIIDSFLGRTIADIARLVRLLGARTVVVGIQPSVAITLVELGLELRGVPAALNVEQGLGLLRRLNGREARNERRRLV